MSIDGRITVDALFHDRDSTSRMKVLSLSSSDGYASGEVVRITGTAGTSALTYIPYNNYRNAAGDVVTLSEVYRIAFAWSGPSVALLIDGGDEGFRIGSKNGEVAVASLNTALSQPIPYFAAPTTGTYTLIMWGDP